MEKLNAIIVGGTGQFGLSISEQLIKKKNKILITSRSLAKAKSKFNQKRFEIKKLNILNKKQIEKLIIKNKPNIIFFLAGQSSPGKSFFLKKETMLSNYNGCKNFLEIIKKNNLETKFINFSSCEIFGKFKNKINLYSKKKPISPYGLAKLKAHNLTKIYREKYNLNTYNAIIFNTESYYRPKNYLIPKICMAAIKADRKKLKTKFGNINIGREWNWCDEQCEYLLKFIKKKPQDFILSNGKYFSAKQMLKYAFDHFNLKYTDYIITDKKFIRKADSISKKSNYLSCLKRNKLKRNDKIFGKKLIFKLINHYINEKNINNYFLNYLLILFLFATFFLYQKHNVGNDSTISEWIINYEGGFTKRGLIGQISIYLSNLLFLNLRDVILVFQTLTVGIYFLLLFNFFKNLKFNKIFILSIFTPIFILYPVAEIEVLARKEIFIFIYLISYTFISLNSKKFKFLYKLFIFPIAILIWEPVIFFLFFFIFLDLVENKITTLNKKIFFVFVSYIPSLILLTYIVLNPISEEAHSLMVNSLKNNFNENCYMSCELLKSKSSIYQQFQGNFGKYSFEIFLRYFLIILIGFGPLFILLFNSKLKVKIIFFKNFDNLLIPFLILLSPVILLFAMGYDWGRWVNISYVFSIIIFVFLYKNNFIFLSEKFLERSLFKKINKKIFIFIIIIFCFGWNPKTVITGDVASFPGYRIPYKVVKILLN